MLRASDFRSREVINIDDGQCLGVVYDMEIGEDGRIYSIVVPNGEKPKIFGKSAGIVIPWERIKRIGTDTILVAGFDSYGSEKP